MEKTEGRPPADPSLRETARSAWTFGLIAVGLALLIPCSSWISALGALPMGLVAVGRARQVLDGERSVDEVTEVYAHTGRLLGLMSAAVSGLFLLVLFAVITVYAVMIAAMFGVTAAVPSAAPVP